MDHHDKLRALLIVALFVVSILPSSILPADAATSTATQTYTVNSPQYFFNGKAQPNVTTTYRFKPTGTVNWFNSQGGNVSLTSPAPSAIVNFNLTAFWYTFSGTFQGATVTVTVYFIKQTNIINGKSYPSPNFKIRLVGTTTAQISFSFSLNNIKGATVDRSNPCAVQFAQVGFNWCDVTNITVAFNPATLQVTMTIPAGSFKIDPTTIGTSTTSLSTPYNNQRKVFFCNTRYWAFYSDGTNLVWRTSTDGITWSSATTVVASTNAQGVSVWNDCTNSKIYYVNGAAFTLFHRAGTLNSDGTITWDYAQMSIPTTQTAAQHPTITKSTDGKLYAAVAEILSTGTPALQGGYIEVKVCTISGTNCGTASNWSTSLTAFQVNTITGTQNMGPTIIPLTSSQLMLVYAKTTSTAQLGTRTFSGSSWNSEVLTTSNYVNGEYAIIAIGDTTYFAGVATSSNIKFWSCAYPCSSAPSELTISSATTSLNAGISSDNSNEIIVSYSPAGSSTSILYKISNDKGSTFGSEQTLINAESIGGASLTLTYTKQNNYYELLWTSNSGFNIRFALIAITVQIIQSKSCTFTGSSGTCAFTSNTLANDAVLVIAGDIVATAVSTVTDTQLLTYSLIVTEDAGTIGDIEGWCAAPTTAAADTITVSYGVSVTATIILYELTTQKCNATSSVGTGTVTTSASVSSYTPSNPTLIIGAVDSTCQVACTVTAGTSYVLDQNVNTGAANKVSTEYIQNFGTAETTPFTFSANSNYNEISMAFVRTFIANPSPSFSASAAFKQGVGKNPSSSFTLSPVFSPALVLSRAFSAAFSASAKFNQGLNLHPFLPTLAFSPAFDFFRGLTPPPQTAAGALLIFGIIIAFTLIALTVFRRRR